MKRDSLRILLLEDSPYDAELVTRELKTGRIDAEIVHVTKEAPFRAAMSGPPFDVILADYNLPGFSGMTALEIACAEAPGTPFIFVSGSIGEDRAIEALRKGATDYILKDRLTRLPSAVERALAEHDERRQTVQTQSVLRAMQERFVLVAQATRDVIWDWSIDRPELWVNDAILSEWGYEVGPDGVSNEWWRERLHPSDAARVVEYFETMIASTELRWQIGYRFRRADGTYGHVQHRNMVIRNDAGVAQRAIGAMADVTALVDAQRHLEQEQRISSLGHVATTISHEFNNVLMGIQPFAEVVKSRSSDDAVRKKAAEYVLSAVERGRQITREILSAARPAEPDLHGVDLSAWLLEVVAEVGGMVQSLIDIVVSVPPHPVMVRCDPRQMHQVITNLVLNARDAIQGAGTIRISLTASDPTAVITVKDSGSGIPESILPHIFDPLFTTKKTGTGLGLAVARQLVTKNGGTIEVASHGVDSTEFTLRLPLNANQESAPAAAVEAPATSSASLRRLLIVEDDVLVLEGMRMLLELEGFELRCVSRVADVANALQSFKPDAVILDLTLPDGDGTDAYRFVEEAYPDMPVLFASGGGEPAFMQELAGRRVGFVRKPYDFATLMKRLQAMI